MNPVIKRPYGPRDTRQGSRSCYHMVNLCDRMVLRADEVERQAATMPSGGTAAAVQPNGGLCNRMFNIAVAVAALDEDESNGLAPVLAVSWVRREACPVDFLELFKPCDRLRLISNTQFSELVRHKAVPVVGAAVKLSHTGRPNQLDRLLQSLFSPIPEIEGEIERFAAAAEVATCIGLHVRRTDHVNVAKSHKRGLTSDEDFDAFVAARRLEAPTQRFFLATDNAQTQQRFVDRWGEAVIVFYRRIGADAGTAGSQGSHGLQEAVDLQRQDGGKARRHTSMVHAVVDLWLLSRCRELYGSNASSYTDFARCMSSAGSTEPPLADVDVRRDHGNDTR